MSGVRAAGKFMLGHSLSCYGGARYVLARLEQDGLIKKGDRLWQLGFGGGFKACSAVWKARRFVQQDHTCWGGK